MEKRECDGCTVCCSGWLHGIVDNKFFQPGKPCHFKGSKGCTIYESRPITPCKDYVCEWLSNTEVASWLKPSESKVLITRRYYEGNTKYYWEVREAGEKMPATILMWLFTFHIQTETPMRIQLDGGWNNFGKKDFFDYIEKEFG